MAQHWKLSIFAALLIVDVLLVAYMLREHHADPEAHGSAATSSKSESAIEPEGEVQAAAKGGNTVFRWWRGSCAGDGRPMLEISDDGGKTFKERSIPVLEEAAATEPGSRGKTVRTILAVDFESADELEIVAGDEKCKPHRYTTNDGGDSWDRQESFKGWFIDSGEDAVVTPKRSVDVGCETIRSLSQFSDTEATVMCAGGRALTTVDEGATWATSGDLNRSVEGALFTGSRLGFAIGKDGECARSYSTEDRGETWQPAGCVEDIEVAVLSGAPSQLVAVGPENVRVSTDEGKTWEKP